MGARKDPDADRLATLAIDASTREVRIRPVLGGEFLRSASVYLETVY